MEVYEIVISHGLNKIVTLNYTDRKVAKQIHQMLIKELGEHYNILFIKTIKRGK